MDVRYLYCITPAAVVPPAGLQGVGGCAVEAIAAGDLAIWTSTLESGRAEASVEAIAAHNSVVEAAIRPDTTPIPLRFGQRLETADEVRDLIDREREAWLAQLKLFAGALEFGLRVIDPERESAARVVHTGRAVGGREYLEEVARRRSEERGAREEAERVASRVREFVGDATVRERVEPLRTRHGLATIAYLVRRVDFADYRDRVTRAREALPALRFLASGPWPPYSFVT